MESEIHKTSLNSPTFRETLRFWLKLGFISFGGPAGQIAIMHRELVERYRWISESHFLHALNFCMLLPGPEAQQLATYLGWRLGGVKGGIAAGALFVLPSAFVLFALSWLYMAGGHLPWLSAIFHGLLGAVIAIILDAILRIGHKALKSLSLWLVAALSFAAIYFFNSSFIIIVIGAALIGAIGHRIVPNQFPAAKGHGNSPHDEDSPITQLQLVVKNSCGRVAKVATICLLLWWTPIFVLAVWLGWQSTPVQQGLFFSKAALVTFGGAYAVLPYVAQQAVESHGWLTHQQMMAGLALAETTPGPLIMVLQFVGFVSGWQTPGPFTPLVAGTIGAIITTWVTFLPSFLFLFLGAPHIERLGTLPRLSASLNTITACVVGVILNLGVKFASNSLWPHALEERKFEVDWFVAIVAILAFIALHRLKIGFMPVVAACGMLGLAYWWIT